MKSIFKCFSFFLILLFLISLASAGSCSVGGYAYCWEERYIYGDARADAKVYFGIYDVNGPHSGQGYAVGEFYSDVGFFGDKLYWLVNLNSWDDLSCDEFGCSGYKVPAGKKIHALPGQEYTNCIAFVAWDRDDASNGDYSWTIAGWGWVGSNCFNVKVVDCLSDSDCSSSEYCDKSGVWQDWDCKQKLCSEGDTKCEGYNQQECENNQWVTIGNVPGTCCDEKRASNILDGECGIDCINDLQCEALAIYFGEKGNGLFGDEWCDLVSGNIKQKNRNHFCENFKCSYNDLEEEVEVCDYGCENNACIENGVECSVNSDCEIGYECIENVCIKEVLECQVNEDCNKGYKCIENVCVEDKVNYLPIIVISISILILIILFILIISKRGRKSRKKGKSKILNTLKY